jgi:hypothetical protein
MRLPKPAKPEPNRHAVQRRGAENAEISAEKTKKGGGKAKIHALKSASPSLFAELVSGFLCAYLCVLCVSALNPPLRLERNSP